MSDLVDQGSNALAAMVRDHLHTMDQPTDDYDSIEITAAYDPAQGTGNAIGDGPGRSDVLENQLRRAVGLR